MHLVLTHENADFDAIASLLGAALLYPEAIALVPPVTNQNVRDFLTLYWGELPFTDYRDRPKGAVKQITLVDTQYLPTPRGHTEQTKIRVIDHHALSDLLLPQAEITLVETGANVTYLIEEIVRANIQVNSIQATLMLLGIHEDCGSLTYGSTTPRDVRAAAWVLEQGAHLDILRDFLHYPLNPTQRMLYNTLINHLETYTIHGNEILISAVQIDERISEISSIAHRLRDLYNPDGLFVLVDMHDAHSPYIQLIARAASDTIHVGHIAEQFGGGGHPRAAAAHIADLTLSQVHDQLLAILEQTIQPAMTVRQIMSFTVRTLAPDQTVLEAADIVTRYGHEGYPVASGNKIVGILTRREIDKAIHHQLRNAKIKQFMHEGEIYVSPDDTIETLQQIMLRERVGQVPVVEGNEIIGIVTRTDLINLWGEKNQPLRPALNLTGRLEDDLPATLLNLLKDAGQEAAKIGSSLFIVGGFVRDLLLGKLSLDIDLVVEGDAIALGNAMRAKYGGHLHTHKRFGTANWIIGGSRAAVGINNTIDRLDFVTARTEFYQHPTALPEVEQSSIRQDLHRRDFTINTLAICLDPNRFGHLLDFYNGYQDLQTGLIRILHSLSFVEDPTRILRAVRFEQRFDFQIGRRTLEHLEDALDLIPRVTAKRIFSELDYIFKEEKPEKALLRLSQLKVLQKIHPDLAATEWLAKRYQWLKTKLAGTPWAAVKPATVYYLGLLTFNLSAQAVTEVVQRLRISANLAKPLTQIQAIKQVLPDLKRVQLPSQIYALLNPYAEEAILVCWLASEEPRVQERLRQFSHNRRHVQPVINGDYLIKEFNLRPSPRFQKILTRLRNARLDGEVASLEEEHRLVVAFLADGQGHEE